MEYKTNKLNTASLKKIIITALVGFVAGNINAAEPDSKASAMNHSHGGSNATAELIARSGSEVNGTLQFIQHNNSNVLIKGTVKGLTPGKHGFHIHVNGNCDSPDGMSAGGHYAPTGGRHGAPAGPERHLGDLGNIVADSNGVAEVSVNVQSVSLALIGLNSIVDRAIIIHAKEDDFSDPTGNSGARVACGIIVQNNDMRM